MKVAGLLLLIALACSSCLRSQVECEEKLYSCIQHRPLKECVPDLKKVFPECAVFYLGYE